MPLNPPDTEIPPGECLLAGLYFIAYLGYLFLNPENEFLHWISLVLLPLLLVVGARRFSDSVGRPLLGSFGLERGNLGRGMGWALLLGAGITVLQLTASRMAPEIRAAFASGEALWKLPLAFALMMVLAGFTEEFFFRGFLQTRLEALTRSRLAGIGLTSIAFGVYHLPYAYLNPHWPSAGNWAAAWQAALGQGVPAGLILGSLYVVSRRNLLACVVLHSLVNALPAMTQLRFGGG